MHATTQRAQRAQRGKPGVPELSKRKQDTRLVTVKHEQQKTRGKARGAWQTATAHALPVSVAVVGHHIGAASTVPKRLMAAAPRPAVLTSVRRSLESIALLFLPISPLFVTCFFSSLEQVVRAFFRAVSCTAFAVASTKCVGSLAVRRSLWRRGELALGECGA